MTLFKCDLHRHASESIAVTSLTILLLLVAMSINSLVIEIRAAVCLHRFTRNRDAMFKEFERINRTPVFDFGVYLQFFMFKMQDEIV